MRQRLKSLTFAAAFSLLALAPQASGIALAETIKAGTLEIMAPIARATPPGAKTGGGYLVITNTGNEQDRLIGGSADFAGKVEIHEMKTEDGIMKMRKLAEGLTIPPGATVRLKPGGNHVMFMRLKSGLKVGEDRQATLVFEKAGKVDVTFAVKSIAETMKLRDAKDHEHGGHKHDGHSH